MLRQRLYRPFSVAHYAENAAVLLGPICSAEALRGASSIFKNTDLMIRLPNRQSDLFESLNGGDAFD
jgi:hypothetical protein